MAEFYRQFAFVSSVLAGFSFTFYGTLLIAARRHQAGTWAAFLAVAATFTAARATNQPSEFSISHAAADPQLALFSDVVPFRYGLAICQLRRERLDTFPWLRDRHYFFVFDGRGCCLRCA